MFSTIEALHRASVGEVSYLVGPASSHMLVCCYEGWIHLSSNHRKTVLAVSSALELTDCVCISLRKSRQEGSDFSVKACSGSVLIISLGCRISFPLSLFGDCT